MRHTMLYHSSKSVGYQSPACYLSHAFPVFWHDTTYLTPVSNTLSWYFCRATTIPLTLYQYKKYYPDFYHDLYTICHPLLAPESRIYDLLTPLYTLKQSATMTEKTPSHYSIQYHLPSCILCTLMDRACRVTIYISQTKARTKMTIKMTIKMTTKRFYSAVSSSPHPREAKRKTSW